MTNTPPPVYQVTLAVFEGPLELLLHLIERQELDITTISLAQVTNQYLEYVAQLGDRNPDSLADFLVVAAKLLLIKSRVLLPHPVEVTASEEGEEDVGEELVRQLLEYRRFKEAARWLRDLEARGLQSYVRLASPPLLKREVDLGDVTLDDLLAAVRHLLAIKPPSPSVNGTLPPVTLTIAQQIGLIERETERGRVVSFTDLVRRTVSRLEVIVTLLALLELVKQSRVTMRQDNLFGDILILRKGPSTRRTA